MLQELYVIRTYANAGFTSWIMDVSGHGRSEEWENPLDIKTKTAAEDIIEAAETINRVMGTEQIDLFGWSWGAMTTSMAAGMRPGLIRKLVLCSPVTDGTFPSMPEEMFQDKYGEVSYAGLSRLFPIKGVTGGIEPGEDFEFDESRVELGMVDKAVHDFMRYVFSKGRPNGPSTEVMCNTDEWKINVDPIKAPTFLCWEDDDIYPSEERIKIMLSKLPDGSEGQFIKGGTHAIPFEKTVNVILHNAIIEFLNK